MTENKEVWIKHLQRFNGVDVGTVRPVPEADAEKWIGMGLAGPAYDQEEEAERKAEEEEAKRKAEGGKGKGPEKPPNDKMAKNAKANK